MYTQPSQTTTPEQVATCPVCKRDGCAVRECYRQATRQEPMRFLGLSGYCPSAPSASPSRHLSS